MDSDVAAFFTVFGFFLDVACRRGFALIFADNGKNTESTSLSAELSASKYPSESELNDSYSPSESKLPVFQSSLRSTLSRSTSSSFSSTFSSLFFFLALLVSLCCLGRTQFSEGPSQLLLLPSSLFLS